MSPLRLESRTFLVSLCILLALSCITLILVLIVTAHRTVGAGRMFTGSLLSNIKEISYMRADAGFEYLWTEWNATEVSSDLAEISSLGANTVRVFIDASTFGFPTPSAQMVQHLGAFISIAAANNLRVQLSLFDNFDSYTETSASMQWADAILDPYRSDPRIAFIELQNEIDPTDATAMSWARAMIPRLRSAAGTTPITLSTASAAGVVGLEELKAALAASPPDFYDYHYYGSAGAAAATLAAAQRVAAPAPLFVGEAGLSTYGGANTATQYSRQAQFFELVDGATTFLGLPDAAAWMMYDLNPLDVPPRKERATLDYGLYTDKHTPKPAAAVVEAFFKTGDTTTVANPGFETVVGGVPTGWAPTNQAAGDFSSDPSVAHHGRFSVRISRASGTENSIAAWETVANLGLVSKGEHLAAAAWAKGTGATGQSLLSVAWFTVTDQYIANVKSPPIPTGNSGWRQLRLDATAPAGAAYATINLQSYQNRGTVWFDDVSVTDQASSPIGTR